VKDDLIAVRWFGIL